MIPASYSVDEPDDEISEGEKGKQRLHSVNQKIREPLSNSQSDDADIDITPSPGDQQLGSPVSPITPTQQKTPNTSSTSPLTLQEKEVLRQKVRNFRVERWNKRCVPTLQITIKSVTLLYGEPTTLIIIT